MYNKYMDYSNRLIPEIISKTVTNDGKFMIVKYRQGKKEYIIKERLNPFNSED